MSKRLLREEEALRKIELSLKLNGKAFRGEYLNCSNCKFRWGNTHQRPQSRQLQITNPITGEPEWKTELPPKCYWLCFNYKNYPYHACLRFKVVRRNTEGQEIQIKNNWVAGTYDSRGNQQTPNHWDSTPAQGEHDTFILVPVGRSCQYRVCRRFESSPRE